MLRRRAMRPFEGGNRLIEAPAREIHLPQHDVRRKVVLVELDRPQPFLDRAVVLARAGQMIGPFRAPHGVQRIVLDGAFHFCGRLVEAAQRAQINSGVGPPRVGRHGRGPQRVPEAFRCLVPVVVVRSRDGAEQDMRLRIRWIESQRAVRFSADRRSQVAQQLAAEPLEEIAQAQHHVRVRIGRVQFDGLIEPSFGDAPTNRA